MKNLKTLRIQHKLSQLELANIFNASQNTISQWESGKREPNNETIKKLADYFNVSIDYLLGHESNPALTAKDERDIAKTLSNTLEQLSHTSDALMFDGEVMDNETQELLKASLENALRMGKALAKQKYTPKKYRK